MEEFPVHEYLKVVYGKTLRKSGKWWTAILLVESPSGARSVRLYRWKMRGGKWKRDSHFSINHVEDWEIIKEEVDRMLEARK